MNYLFYIKLLLICIGLKYIEASTYKKNDKVPIYVNKVGPYFNTHETYHYYTLPVCRPIKVEHKSMTLGEVLDGDRMAYSLYDVSFQKNEENKLLCKLILNDSDVEALKEAIEDLYYFEFIVGDVPVRGFIGRLEEGNFLPHTHKTFLWQHHTFFIEYNKDKIIYANVSTKEMKPASLETNERPLEIQFTYSVNWVESSVAFKDREKRIRDNSFFPKTLEIHWLSIINSIVLVFLLIGFIFIILARILKRDFDRYNTEFDEDVVDEDDIGWKIIHSDVFRFPPYKSLFCAILGVGSQFLLIATFIIVMAMLGMFNVHRHGSINTAAILLYALTSCVSGYVAANMYKKMGGDAWVWNVNLTSALFALPFFVVWSFVNSVAWAYGSTQALPWTTVFLLIALWVVLGYPLTVMGAIFGKNFVNGFDAPCRTKNIPREIPVLPWYRCAFCQCMIGGFLPFSAISVELYYIFSTLWGREQYTLYGILFIIFIILLSVTACMSVSLIYFQLNAEDYRWWWRSVLSAGSSGFFVLLYATFYYVKRSNMSGVLQSVQFFGYTFLACYVFFLMLAAVGFFSALRFVRFIYVNIKMD